MSVTAITPRAAAALEELHAWVADGPTPPPGMFGARGGVTLDDFGGTNDLGDRGRFVAVVRRGVAGAEILTAVSVEASVEDAYAELARMVRAGEVRRGGVARVSA